MVHCSGTLSVAKAADMPTAKCVFHQMDIGAIGSGTCWRSCCQVAIAMAGSGQAIGKSAGNGMGVGRGIAEGALVMQSVSPA